MTLIDTIATEIHRQRRMLARIENLPPIGTERIATRSFTFKNWQIAQMLRVEIARELEGDLRRNFYDLRLFDRTQAGWMEGPLTIMGVAWYIVNQLPDPGWRVINPMVEPKPTESEIRASA